MKKGNFDSVFGNQDKGFKSLIEGQAKGNSQRVKPDKGTKAKSLIKTRNLTAKRYGERNK